MDIINESYSSNKWGLIVTMLYKLLINTALKNIYITGII